MLDGPVIGKYVVLPDDIDLGIPVERRIVRIDGASGDPAAPYVAMDFNHMTHINIPAVFEREATQEEMDAVKKRVGESLSGVLGAEAEGEADAANAETPGQEAEAL